ncbi:RagB/SusD family nutrient uptake outer membrane protein [Arachidicoccus soli]|uniref:RagB/SusD family nutrient uptake outer membrane protein n=1 Tax=Arachidicoccus soli TaxID=2341117 RepID=A0A386HP28_9BACT|nr:RagB/SusD family nutrient uptake outer membrane protein [Arachidicoccus soli]AYD47399.1 RagB/SusD family nutrient uptake outer membrane protein [Arachidicoccus soli]
MKYKHIHILLPSICMLFLLLSGCKKFLDAKQNAAAVVPSTLSDLQAMMDNGAQISYISPSLPEASCDDYYLTTDMYNSFVENAQDFYTWRNYTPPPNSANDWGDTYHAVYYANLTLDLIKDIPRNGQNATQWDNIKGSALFFRSYHFLNLLWEFSKAYDSTTANKDWGIALRMTSDFNIPSTRATNEQSYRQVIDDAKSSISLLPDYPLVAASPSKGAAYGLLARCYLSMRDYKDALLYSDSCLQLKSNLIDFNGDADIIGSLANEGPFKQYNKETIFYCEMNAEFDIFTYTGYVDSTITGSYATNDLRKTAYLLDEGNNHYYFKGSYAGSPYVNFTGIATDEMYLTRAECYIRTGQVKKGLDDLNTLLSKRYRTGTFIPLTGMAQQTALTTVLLERRKELLFRGSRWMDIKRLNKSGADIVLKRIVGHQSFTLQPNAAFFALPLPVDIVQITGMPQN